MLQCHVCVCLFTALILFFSLSIQPFAHHRSGSSADLFCGAVPASVVYSTVLVVQRYRTCPVATGDRSLYVQLPRQSLNEYWYCNIRSLFAPPPQLPTPHPPSFLTRQQRQQRINHFPPRLQCDDPLPFYLSGIPLVHTPADGQGCSCA